MWPHFLYFEKKTFFLSHNLHYLTPEYSSVRLGVALWRVMTSIILFFEQIMWKKAYSAALRWPARTRSQYREWRGSLRVCVDAFVFAFVSLGKLSERSLRLYLLICDSLFKTPLKLQHLPPDSHSLRFVFNEALGSSPLTFIQPHFSVCLWLFVL